MGLIAFLILGALLGVGCFLLVKYVPMAAPWPTAIPIVALLVWLLILFVIVLGGVSDIQIPSLRR